MGRIVNYSRTVDVDTQALRRRCNLATGEFVLCFICYKMWFSAEERGQFQPPIYWSCHFRSSVRSSKRNHPSLLVKLHPLFVSIQPLSQCHKSCSWFLLAQNQIDPIIKAIESSLHNSWRSVPMSIDVLPFSFPQAPQLDRRGYLSNKIKLKRINWIANQKKHEFLWSL